MKLLILGGNGMAGHMLADYFRRQGKHHVFHTTRDKSDLGGLYVDANDIAGVEKLVDIVSLIASLTRWGTQSIRRT